MRIEGVKNQGTTVGSGNIGLATKEGKLVFQVTGKPRTGKEKEIQFKPMEKTVIEIPLGERNIKAVFRLAVEGRNSLIAKALKEKDDQEFDVKLKGGEGIYIGIRGYHWGFSLLARKGNQEALLIMKPREFYPVVRFLERLSIERKKASSVISKDLDFLVCEAEKGKGLTFRTVDEWKVVGELKDKATLIALIEDLSDRVRIDGMYTAKFETISLVNKNGSTFLKCGGRHYTVTRKELLSLKLLAETALN